MRGFFAALKDPRLRKAVQLALLLRKRPSEILNLEGSEAWLLEVDYRLLMDEIERASTGEDESPEEKVKKMKEWWEEKRQK